MISALLILVGIVLSTPSAEASNEGLSEPDATYLGRKDKEEQEEEISEAEKERLQKMADKASRIVVLKWPNTSTDYQDPALQRNVKSRIDRAGALFFPAVDLYQNGRRVPDETVIPANQPAWVPDANLDVITNEAAKVSQIPWDAMSSGEWGLQADKLRRMVELVWFVEKVEQREPLFHLYTMIGYAAENQNSPSPPYYEQIGGQSVNYYYYLAATLAWQDPSLMSKLSDMEIRGQVNYYLDGLTSGRFPFFPLDFELENEWDAEEFAKEYQVFLNGLEIEITDDEAQYKVPLGRQDIYFKRQDTGHGLSDQLIVDKFEDKAYFVRNEARKRMGYDLIDQLMLHPNECTPPLDGDILVYLAIYARMHSAAQTGSQDAEIYIAVPKNGDPNKVWIWRYDRPTATLQLVGGGQDDFPVRFAVTVKSGVMYNGAAFSVDTTVDNADINAITDPVGDATSRGDVDLQAAHLPVDLMLRGHYNRLMVGLGMEFGWNLGSEGLWVERYWTPEHKADYGELLVVEKGPAEEGDNGQVNGPEVYHYKAWNRYTHFDIGVVLGRNAALGFGPRFSLSTGWTNLPHAYIAMGHFGWSIEPPIEAFKGSKRVRPMIDADVRGGIAYSLADSIQTDIAALEAEQGRLKPIFGITAGIGTTF